MRCDWGEGIFCYCREVRSALNCGHEKGDRQHALVEINGRDVA